MGFYSELSLDSSFEEYKLIQISVDLEKILRKKIKKQRKISGLIIMNEELIF
jgi:hypothetical protein